MLLSNKYSQFPNMDSVLKAVFPCLYFRERGIQLPAETEKGQQIYGKLTPQSSPHGSKESKLCNDDAASSIVSAMLDADKPGTSLDATIESLVHEAGGWTEGIAKKILATLEVVIRAAKPMNAAMQEAYDRAMEEAKKIPEFAAEHPIETAVICTVIALGILVTLAPYVVEYLGFCAGFGELGPIEGKLRFLCSVATRMVY